MDMSLLLLIKLWLSFRFHQVFFFSAPSLSSGNWSRTPHCTMLSQFDGFLKHSWCLSCLFFGVLRSQNHSVFFNSQYCTATRSEFEFILSCSFSTAYLFNSLLFPLPSFQIIPLEWLTLACLSSPKGGGWNEGAAGSGEGRNAASGCFWEMTQQQRCFYFFARIQAIHNSNWQINLTIVPVDSMVIYCM